MTGSRCCWGCCSVRTGTKIIAVVYIVYTCFSIIVNIIGADIESRRRSSYAYNGSTGSSTSGIVFAMALSVVQLVLSSMLFVGARKNDKRKCLPWLWYNTVITVLYVILLTVLGVYITAAIDLLWGFIFLAVLIIVAAILIYCLSVVHLYIQELREGAGGSVRYHIPIHRTTAPEPPTNIIQPEFRYL